MNRYILFILAIAFCSLGTSFIIIYMNLLSYGYSLFEYIIFLLCRLECWFLVGGVGLLLYLKYK